MKRLHEEKEYILTKGGLVRRQEVSRVHSITKKFVKRDESKQRLI